MSTITLIVVVSVALLTLVALAVVVLLLVRQVRDLAARVSQVQERLGPQLELLSREAEIAGRELERIADAADADGSHRDLGAGPGRPYTGGRAVGEAGSRRAPGRRNEGSPWD